ncbi:MAG: hypothetical protein EHM72_01030 [Calditrichaeota bacterium]|nr:MAG: hypothetical protein EHM72_01030 [Calditrichota bacterium]
MNKTRKRCAAALMVILLAVMNASSQVVIDRLHGDQTWSMNGLHSGNQIRTHFYNDGMIGDRPDEEIGGEWPINSGYEYLSKATCVIGAEVEVRDDTTGSVERIVIFSEGNGSLGGDPSNQTSGDADPNTGAWWTMCPVPFFANQFPGTDENGKERNKSVAMSHWPWSWPNVWPDKFDDVVDPVWAGSWIGYFVKIILNADQESYYVMDDYNNREFPFYPDSTDLDRRGLGIRATVRQFQWSNVLVEDCLFLLYDAMNIGTYKHDKIVFGLVSGPNIGIDSEDDGGAFILQENLGYQFDEDNIGTGGWTPVGLLGWAFFESPGNPTDGIDNDGDGTMGSGMVISEDTFAPKTVNLGDDIVLINYKNFERTLTKMPAEGVRVTYLGREYHIKPGDSLEEIQDDLIDNNLNGLIDESNGSIFGDGANTISYFLYVGLKAIDYFTGNGNDNILIDERRDDTIDNDSDWSLLTDDVGLDGVPRSGDPGEGDGVPTSGAGTLLPGEPHIDKTDIDESDMIGLTSFNIHEPWTIYPLSQDQILWDEAVRPGFLNERLSGGNTDVFLGSGYFPLQPGEIERFSIGMLFAYGPEPAELIRNKQYAEKTYLENYNFAKAPNIPTLKAVAGDKRVTLIWDDYAEQSVDPILGKDFQGYRIYRSTDPAWKDMDQITDGYGSVTLQKPLVQFDLSDGISGYSGIDVNGVLFYLGDDTGIVHSYVDTTVRNGQLYYYAVTAYDRGGDSLGIAPTETSKYISIATDGTIDKGNNVTFVRPEAPSLGFSEADLSGFIPVSGGRSTGKIGYEIIDPTLIKDDHQYQISFEDTLLLNDAGVFAQATKNMSVVDKTSGVILIDRTTKLTLTDEQPVTDGFRLKISNPSATVLWADSTYWNDAAIYAPSISIFRYSKTLGIGMARDYVIEFGDTGIDTSTVVDISTTRRLPAIPVNFTIKNLQTGDPVDFGIWEKDVLPGEEGMFTAFSDKTRSDQVVLVEKLRPDTTVFSWSIEFNSTTNDSLHRNPRAGDKLIMRIVKPFLAHDVYEFTATGRSVDAQLVKEQMEKVRVVPNPYVVSNSWEPLNPYTNGRGPRELHFVHLPAQCTIRIFNIRGQLVREIEHNTPDVADGTEIWDMLSKDQLEIAYGIYIYYIDGGELGEKTGKFAVIK